MEIPSFGSLRIIKLSEGQMSFTPLSIQGSWVFTPKKFDDERGSFHEVFKLSSISETLGIDFHVKQVNQSVSKAGVIRGIHWADFPPGQAKYVFCPKGSIWDIVVDIRVGSPTFGKWDADVISEKNGKAVLIQEGLGHVFLALEDNTVVNYLCNEPYNPTSEHEINPLDEKLGIPFADKWSESEFLTSPKDSNAYSLAEAKEKGLLPKY
jgi:dTDP-4-dehydrorhamnose 3,5-epimerase